MKRVKYLITIKYPECVTIKSIEKDLRNELDTALGGVFGDWTNYGEVTSIKRVKK